MENARCLCYCDGGIEEPLSSRQAHYHRPSENALARHCALVNFFYDDLKFKDSLGKLKGK